MVSNPFLTDVFADFNAKSNIWYNNDTTTYKGSKIDNVTFQFGQQQIINPNVDGVFRGLFRGGGLKLPKVMDTNFSSNVSNEKLLNAEKC